MNVRDTVVTLWQGVPLSWRQGLVRSRFAPLARRCVNRCYPAGLRAFALADPLQGYRMRLNWRSQKAFAFGTYETDVVHLLRRMVQPNWVVFDVGAHIGYFALLLSRMVGPGGKVVAFEPSPDIFRILEENVRMNDCRNVVLENRAVAATTGVMTLRLNDADPLTSTASLVHGKPMAEVETVTVDEYASGFGEQIHMVMMDVEGAEEAVLQGMRSTVRRDLPILLIELHGFDSWGRNHPALRELDAMDYDFRFVDTPGAQAHVLAEPRVSRTDGGKTVR